MREPNFGAYTTLGPLAGCTFGPKAILVATFDGWFAPKFWSASIEAATNPMADDFGSGAFPASPPLSPPSPSAPPHDAFVPTLYWMAALAVGTGMLSLSLVV